MSLYASKYLVRLFLKFLPNHKRINKQTKVPFIPVLPFFLVLGFASAEFWQMSEEKNPTMSLTPVWQKQFLYDYCVSQSCWKPYRSCQQGWWKFVWTSKTISIRICCESELSKSIGPVSRADENLSEPRVSSKTLVQMTGRKNVVIEIDF